MTIDEIIQTGKTAYEYFREHEITTTENDKLLWEACHALEQLQAELATSKAENEHLCETIESIQQDYDDLIAGLLEKKLQEELDVAKAENVDLKAGINSGADRYAKLWAENKWLRDEIRARR